MSPRLKLALGAILILMIVLCGRCAAGTAEMFYINGPTALMGQLAAARESRALSPRAYASADFVLGQIPLSDVERAVFIHLPGDVLFWDHQYLGFPRTEVGEAELRALQERLASGDLFALGADGRSYDCIIFEEPASQPRQVACEQGAQLQDGFEKIRSRAVRDGQVGVLELYLSDGRLAEIRLYWSEGGLAYDPYVKSGPWWLDGVAGGPAPMIFSSWVERATVPPIPVLWPEKRAEVANARAARRLGRVYGRAVDTVQASEMLRFTLGEIQEIRPAAGMNWYSTWMDSTSATLTFRVTGEGGEAAVLVRGNKCFEGEMVVNGTLMEINDVPFGAGEEGCATETQFEDETISASQ